MKKHLSFPAVITAIAALATLLSACGGKGGTGGGKSSDEGAPLKGQNPSDLKESVAKIDDVSISVGDFQQRINQQSPYIRARYTSLERKKEFLDNMVRFEVLAKEAGAKGFDKDPEVIRTMKQVMIQKLMKEEFDNRVKLEDVKDDECMKFYKEHNDEYNKPEEVRVSDILLKDNKKASDIIKEIAGKAKNGVIDNAIFRDLVTKNTEDAKAKESGGDLRYFAESSTEYPKELVKAAFALKEVGNFTDKAIKAGEGYHVMMLTGRRKALVRNFDEVKRQIQNRLYRDKRTQAMEDYVTELKKKSHVQVNDANLSKVMIDTSQGATFGGVPVPGGGAPAPGPGAGLPVHGGLGATMPPAGGATASGGATPIGAPPAPKAPAPSPGHP
jgi:peptidyl-prolyl cis-trans isomerase C